MALTFLWLPCANRAMARLAIRSHVSIYRADATGRCMFSFSNRFSSFRLLCFVIHRNFLFIHDIHFFALSPGTFFWTRSFIFCFPPHFTPCTFMQALWQYLFSQNRAWGLRVIKQDHMASQIRSAQNAAFSNISVLNSWLDGMGKAATDNDIGEPGI